MWPIVKILWMLNWWIGSISPVSLKLCRSDRLFEKDRRSSARGFIRNNPRRPHHVDHAGGEAEQEEHDETPWRGRQQTVEAPAKSRPDDNTRDQFGRKAETARES